MDENAFLKDKPRGGLTPEQRTQALIEKFLKNGIHAFTPDDLQFIASQKDFHQAFLKGTGQKWSPEYAAVVRLKSPPAAVKKAAVSKELEPFFEACGSGNTSLLFDFFRRFETRRLLTETDGGDRPALHVAVKFAKVSVVELLLSKGADVDSRDRLCRTTPMVAALSGHTKLLEMLLRASPRSIDAVDHRQRGLLHFAALAPAVACVKLLFLFDTRHTVDIYGRTPLHYAAGCDLKETPEIVSALIASGIDINQKDEDGKTAAHVAAETGRAKLIPLLIKSGADLSIRENRLGKTAIELASSERIRELIVLHSCAPPPKLSEANLSALVPTAKKVPLRSQQEPSKPEPPLGFSKGLVAPYLQAKFKEMMRSIQKGAVKSGLFVSSPSLFSGSWLEGVGSPKALAEKVEGLQPDEVLLRVFNILEPFEGVLRADPDLVVTQNFFAQKNKFASEDFMTAPTDLAVIVDSKDKEISELTLQCDKAKKEILDLKAELAKLALQQEKSAKTLEKSLADQIQKAGQLTNALRIKEEELKTERVRASKFEENVTTLQVALKRANSELALVRKVHENSLRKIEPVIERKKDEPKRNERLEAWLRSAWPFLADHALLLFSRSAQLTEGSMSAMDLAQTCNEKLGPLATDLLRVLNQNEESVDQSDLKELFKRKVPAIEKAESLLLVKVAKSARTRGFSPEAIRTFFGERRGKSLSKSEFADFFQNDSLTGEEIDQLFVIADSSADGAVNSAELEALILAGDSLLGSKSKPKVPEPPKLLTRQPTQERKRPLKEKSLKVQVFGQVEAAEATIRLSAGGKSFTKKFNSGAVKTAVRFSEREAHGSLEVEIETEGKPRKERVDWSEAKSKPEDWVSRELSFGTLGHLRVKFKYSAQNEVEELDDQENLDPNAQAGVWTCQTDFEGQLQVQPISLSPIPSPLPPDLEQLELIVSFEKAFALKFRVKCALKDSLVFDGPKLANVSFAQGDTHELAKVILLRKPDALRKEKLFGSAKIALDRAVEEGEENTDLLLSAPDSPPLALQLIIKRLSPESARPSSKIEGKSQRNKQMASIQEEIDEMENSPLQENESKPQSLAKDAPSVGSFKGTANYEVRSLSMLPSITQVSLPSASSLPQQDLSVHIAHIADLGCLRVTHLELVFPNGFLCEVPIETGLDTAREVHFVEQTVTETLGLSTASRIEIRLRDGTRLIGRLRLPVAECLAAPDRWGTNECLFLEGAGKIHVIMGVGNLGRTPQPICYVSASPSAESLK